MPPALRATVVPHTHWDRAWYLPFELYRARLVSMIDHALGLLEADPELRFTLDGQTVVIEDYLALRPKQAQRLRALVRARRLFVGPWYILPDEFLVSGEALIRNLRLGRAQAAACGRRMQVGYLPDPFGHISQLPQLLRGFGLDSVIFQRGLDPLVRQGPLELEWEGPDGSRLLAIWQRDGYGNLDRLGLSPKQSYDPEQADPARWRPDPALGVAQLRNAVERLRPELVSGVALLGNGSDHRFLQPEVLVIAALADNSIPGLEVRIGGYEDHVSAVRAALQGRKLSRVRGELTYPYGELLMGVYSARLPLKQENERLQTLLERTVEPLLVLRSLEASTEQAPWFSAGAASSLLANAWKKLLKNHPHDDICGCGVDQTHREMEWRFARVDQVATQLIDDALEALGQRAPRADDLAQPYLLFTPLGAGGERLVRATLRFPRGQAPRRFALEEVGGDAVPYHALARRRGQRVALDLVEEVDEIDVAFRARALPDGGLRCYNVRPGQEPAAARERPGVRVTARGLETPFAKLRVQGNGSLRLDDLRTGTSYRGLHLFEDQADAGDEYNFCPLPGRGDRVTTQRAKASMRCVRATSDFATLCVELTLTLPAGLRPDRRARGGRSRRTRIRTEITAYAHTPRIDLETTLDNRCRDHRLRALFPTPFTCARAQVEQAFDVVERPVRRPPSRAGVPPTSTQHQKSFINLQRAGEGLALLNRGLPEVEVIPGERGHTIALTLVRAVGWLSREGLETRPLHAGPPLETPGAQCQGPLRLRYALLPHNGGRGLPATVQREALRYTAPARLVRVAGIAPGEATPLPTELPLVRLEPEALVLSAAKLSAHSGAWVLRFFNPTSRATEARITLARAPARVARVRLDETELDEAPEDDRPAAPTLDGAQVRVACAARQIVTLLIHER